MRRIANMSNICEYASPPGEAVDSKIDRESIQEELGAVRKYEIIEQKEILILPVGWSVVTPS